MKKSSTLALCALVLACFAFFLASPAFSAGKEPDPGKPGAPSATVSLEFGQGSFILSTSGGKGTLRFKGRNYPFKIGSVGFGGLGVSKVVATGEVYNLKRVEDFPGAYAQARAGFTAGSGKGVQWLQNTNGVSMKLSTITTGVALNLGADGMVIEMGIIKK